MTRLKFCIFIANYDIDPCGVNRVRSVAVKHTQMKTQTEKGEARNGTGGR